MSSVLTAIEAAYLAGLIDGEGSISVNRTKTSSSAKACKRGFAYRSSLVVAMTDLSILEWAQNITGVGKICVKKRQSPKHKPAWTWAVWSNEAVSLLIQLLPYLRIKLNQAENLIEFQKVMRYPGKNGLSDEEWTLREFHHNKSHILNQRGVPV